MRETCAQVLGVTTIHLDAVSVHIIARKIVQFLTRPEWEVRHGGLLGLKYILAARQVCLQPSIFIIRESVLLKLAVMREVKCDRLIITD